jgi:hypothetical protein
MIAVSDAYLPSNVAASSNDENFRAIQEGDVFDLCLHWNPSATMTYEFKAGEPSTEVDDANARLLSVCRNRDVKKSRGAPMKTRVKQTISEEMRLKNKMRKRKIRQVNAEKKKAPQEFDQGEKDSVLEALVASIQRQKDNYALDQQRKREEIEKEKNQRNFQRKVADRFGKEGHSHGVRQKVVDCSGPALKKHKAA